MNKLCWILMVPFFEGTFVSLGFQGEVGFLFGLNLPFGGYIISGYMIYDFISFFYLVYEDAISRVFFHVFLDEISWTFEELEVRFVRNDATSTTSFWLQLEGGFFDGTVYDVPAEKYRILLGGRFWSLPSWILMVWLLWYVVMLEDVIWQGQGPPSCDVISLAAWMWLLFGCDWSCVRRCCVVSPSQHAKTE